MSKRNIKIFGLSVLMLAAITFFWWQLSIFFVFGKNVTFKALIYLGIDFLGVLILVLIFDLFVNDRKIAYLCFLFSSAFFFLFFPLSYLYLISQIVFLLLFILAFELMYREKQYCLKISSRKIWYRGLPYLITAIVLSITIVYYQNPLLRLNQSRVTVSPRLVNILVKPASILVGKTIPFYSPDMTVDDFILATLKNNSMLRQFERSKFSKVVEEKILEQQRKSISKTLGVKIEGNETVDILLSKIINARLGKYIGPYAKQIAIGVAVALFLVLRVVGAVIGLIAIIFSQIIFLILKAVKFLRIEKVPKEAEVIKI
ncbi:hypothetical protein J7K86_02960 [bacterium]|nr:hypothetical protein [bacterium]